MSDNFIKAIELVLKHEGGYVNDPDDPGGETNFGISKRSYPHLNIKELTREDAVEIYQKDWWERYRYNQIDSARLAAKVFDIAINVGPSASHIHLQLACNRVSGTVLKPDGILGTKTLDAVNDFTHTGNGLLLREFKLQMIKYYADLRQEKFLRGWIYRALEDVVEG